MGTSRRAFKTWKITDCSSRLLKKKPTTRNKQQINKINQSITAKTRIRQVAARTRRANESTTVHKKTKRVNKKKWKKLKKKKKRKKMKKKKKSKKNKRLSTPRIRSGNQSVESAGKRNAGRRAPKWQRFRVAASHRVGSCSKRTRHQQVLFLFFLSFSVCVCLLLPLLLSLL